MKNRIRLSAIAAVAMAAVTTSGWADSQVGGPRSTGVIAKPAVAKCDDDAINGAKVVMNEDGRLNDLWPASKQRCRNDGPAKAPRIGGPRSTH
jgi:hypothetical protein